jgi:hypothetical protein
MDVKRVSPADIAKAMEMNEAECWQFARTLGLRFTPTRICQIAGKVREIDSPFRYTKKKLRLLHSWLQSERAAHPIAYGGVRGKSCFKHAQKHLGKKFVWTRDISNCFPSVESGCFLRVLSELGFRDDTAQLLTMLCTLHGRIPQGSPVSNDALNLYMYSFDQWCSASAGRLKISVGRFSDDIVVSTSNKEVGDSFIRQIEEKLELLGFQINEKKRRKLGLQTRSAPQIVHSIRVDHPKGTAISWMHRSQAILLANKYLEACQRIQPDSLQSVARMRKRLEGYMYYCRQANISPAKHVHRQMQVGDRAINRKFSQLRISIAKNKWWLKTKKKDEPARLTRVWQTRIETICQPNLNLVEAL